MTLFLLSFFAGVVTVLAPCSFLLLPIILGSSASSNQKWRPYVITLSLGASLFVSTILLKATTLLINVNPVFLQYLSGVLLIVLGLISLFPELWDKINIKLGLSTSADKFLNNAGKNEGLVGSILTGVALGPVFSSCSPTYVYLLTTVLRENLASGLLHIFAYLLGLTLVMLGVSLLGQKFVKSLKFAINPKGWFKRTVSILFILVGIAILFGFDKTLQAQFAPLSPVGQLEQNLLNQAAPTANSSVSGEITPRPAPEIQGVTDWINSNGETIAKNKGKVILVSFWTYSCINCVRDTPYLNSWYDKYKDQGFIILGMHAPEFAFEKNKDNVEKAVNGSFNIKYPVGLDNDFDTWNAYQNQFWPAAYLIDKDGNLRYTHSGEGNYDQTETEIKKLLAEAGAKVDNTLASDNVAKAGDYSADQSPETYLGWSRGANFANSAELSGNENKDNLYSLKPDLTTNQWSVGGTWEADSDHIVAKKDGTLKFNFSAKEVFLVASPSADNQQIKVMLNGQPVSDQNAGVDVSGSSVKLDGQRMYKLIKLPAFASNQTLDLTVDPGATLYVFTFGS
jgi:cytochrome c biogenesis protein CcdA/thiol-disulfide isomerase/thioredoxin